MAYFMSGANGPGPPELPEPPEPPQQPSPEPRNRLKDHQQAQTQVNSQPVPFSHSESSNYNAPTQRQVRIEEPRQEAIDPELPDWIFQDLALYSVLSYASSQLRTSPQRQVRQRKGPFKNPFGGFYSWSIRRSKQILWKFCPILRKRHPLSHCSKGHVNDMPSRVQQRPAPTQSQPQTQAHGLANGHCMTCGSLMRWPRELKTFRCTICVTVNELTPLRPQAKSQHEGESSVRGSTSTSRRSKARDGHDPRLWPISLSTTQKLVRDCIHTYLTGELCGEPSRQYDASTKGSQAELIPGRRLELYTGCNELPYTKAGDQSSTRDTEYVPKFTFGEAPTLRLSPSHASILSESPVERVRSAADPCERNSVSNASTFKRNPTKIFDPVQDYIRECFGSFEGVASSFPLPKPRGPGRSGGNAKTKRPSSNNSSQISTSPPNAELSYSPPLCELDPKLLLLGSFAENGTWWAGGQAIPPPQKSTTRVEGPSQIKPSPINWPDVTAWYDSILNAAEDWSTICAELSQRPDYNNPTEKELKQIEENFQKSQLRLRRALLKITENLLKKPGGKLTDPEEMRCLLILLENPLLHWDPDDHDGKESSQSSTIGSNLDLPNSGPLSGRHSGIIKRIVGLIANLPPECHLHLVAHWSRSRPDRFLKTKELVFGFFTYRLLRHRPIEAQGHSEADLFQDLIPYLEPGSSGSSLHHEIGSSSRPAAPSQKLTPASYAKDWQIKAACRVLSLLFNANSPSALRRLEEATARARDAPLATGRKHSQGKEVLFVPMSDFYSSVIDYVDFSADFKAWESKQSFAFCEFPFLLSIWAKTQVLEHDMRRQMRDSAREAFFDSVMHRREISQVLSLDVRRDCIVDDSLTAIGESLGSPGDEAKKALRISFRGEEGIDGGGLRKEWFLLLIREVFNPERGLFLYDEDSRLCYFNPFPFESSKEFYLIGAILGLAIYNSTILDVPFPPFLFRKLLASGPSPTGRTSQSVIREPMRYTLDDLAQYRPVVAKGLRQILEHDGNVERDFGLDFTIPMNKNGKIESVPLCEDGENRPVTNANSREYVDLYVRYVLDLSVKKHFDPFKRGFYAVCSGNAFGLFRPEEVELLLRGSDESLDISALRGVATYDGWSVPQPDRVVEAVCWFWELFEEASNEDQRKLLSFITGSDRLPAAGASMTPLRITNLGEDCGKFPIARTCFNIVSLWNYQSKERLSYMLWRAVYEGGGFGLK